jgi:two-component system, cell cycle sensor histidine kinase DivJ
VKASVHLDVFWSHPACLPAGDRLRLFKEARIAAAAVILCLFPALALASGEAPAVIASLLLAGLLPAVVALDVRRPARLDRAAALYVVITAAVLTGGVLRGLPAAAAALLVCLAAIESFAISRQRGRMLSALAALAGLAALSAASIAVHARAAPAAESGAAGLAAALLALVGAAVLIRGLAALARRQTQGASRDKALSGHIETVMSETVLAIDRSGGVVHVSVNAPRILGLDADELRGRGLQELTLVADRPALLTAIADSATVSARRKVRFRLRRNTRDRLPDYRWAELAIEPSAPGRLTIAALRDVSADVVEEEHARTSAMEADAAKRARAAFLSTVSHELRTPLNAVIGFSEILSNPTTMPADEARVREYAAIVKGAGQDLLRMVSAMIDITRIDSGVYDFEAEDADVIALVESAVEAFRQEPEARGEAIAIRCGADALQANVDAKALRSILFQLLSNAAKYGGGKGVEVEVSGSPHGVAIRVADKGPGIAADKLALLERNFACLDEGLSRERGGIGLGLALARGLTALHGGKITIDSRPGRGTAVTLHLGGAEPSSASNVRVLAPVARSIAAHAPAAAPDHGRDRKRA